MFETWPGFELAASRSADFPANILLLNCHIVWFILYPLWFVSLSVWWSVEAPVTSLATDPQSHLMSTFVAFNKNKSHCELVLWCTLLPDNAWCLISFIGNWINNELSHPQGGFSSLKRSDNNSVLQNIPVVQSDTTPNQSLVQSQKSQCEQPYLA